MNKSPYPSDADGGEADAQRLLADRLRAEARSFAYPPTPNLAATLRRLAPPRPARRGRLLLRLALVAALLLAALLAVPEVRAAALRLLQLGAVRVLVEPGPAPAELAPTPPAAPAAAQPTPDLGLLGAIPVAEAADHVAFPVRLPAHPPELGPPDLAYLQDLDGEALVLVWLDPADPQRPLLSLHALSSDAFVQKTLYGPETALLAETAVNGAPALWVRGPHFLETGRSADLGFELRRIVPGDTLIWTVGHLTYRLETTLPMEEAVLVAESLR
jgi:hypothetical protein